MFWIADLVRRGWLRRTACAAIAAVAIVGPAAARETAENAGSLCADAIAAEERRGRMPARILAAIAAVESGRWDREIRANIAWPWTVTARGEGKFYPTRQAAIQAVKALRQRGISNIDVGCMQINLFYHPDAFESLQEAFEPAANVAYAAEFLAELREQKRSWQRAVRFYHSSDPERQRVYGNKVFKARQDIRAREAKSRREQRMAQRERQRSAQKATPPQISDRARAAAAGRFAVWPPRSYRAQRLLENRARNWALSPRRR